MLEDNTNTKYSIYMAKKSNDSFPKEETRGRKKGCVKTGGRKIGSKNKLSSNIRSKLKDQLDPFLDNIGRDLAEIDDPKERVQAIVSLLPFCAPKMQSIDMNAKQEHDISIEKSLIALDERFSEKKAELMRRKIKLVSFE